ncbi:MULTISPECIES: PilN domain-containing protein [Marinobacter]|jgi:type IV pilus assembly protein PilN|uniref:PilN domain-containing protein n=1 Tax=Marinobacter TaxID=2742 RepID=UPI000BD6682C|nr:MULTISPECIES: PilN domain-containing protein [Marinobacter]PCI06027.1 MAG: pilus assembly protein PilN [Hyphomicrobiales bacterium]MAB50974.1 pilus assembly protein PilN [Marinobacter sp.]MBE96284.1 pilus assembly protein PilN [Marinobacter sp.]MBE97326.1 pilus assembly protein PilN [Marinobacter sp.]MBJ7277684.1 PilN domain-containing protein [Marinobacter salarius]|tara:strand:- start:4825 stop:5388 length:564 start_codon:yes stop_codon:yes gene_type:complete
MAKINLRPWREELRAEKQKQFVVMILGAAFIAVGLTFLWKTDMDNRIAYQESRNAYIETATKQLDKQIKEIEDLKRKRDELLSRMQVIQDLQGKRPVIVRVFDELVRTLPDGLFYTNLKKTGDTVDVVGMSESNSRISALMRRFEESDWFTNPNLSNVSAADNRRAGYSQFNLSVQQQTPEPEGEDK